MLWDFFAVTWEGEVGCNGGVVLEVVFDRHLVFVLLIMFCGDCYYTIKLHLRMRHNILYTR